MKFKTTIFIIIFISMLSLTTVNASDDIIQNTTDQISIDDENAVLSDVYYIEYDYKTSGNTMMMDDDDGNILFEHTSCTVGPTTGIVLNASYYCASSNGLKTMFYSASRGTYDPTTGIWDIGDFYGEETLMVFSYNEHSSQSWEDFVKTDMYSSFLEAYVELNQTNILVNPDAVDRMPHIIDLSLTGGDFRGEIAPESEIANCTRSFTVKCEGGIAENTIVEYRLDENFILQYYEASKGTYNRTAGIWYVGNVSDNETLTVYMTVDKTYLLSIIQTFWDDTSIVARTTSDEVDISNNVLNSMSNNSTVVTKSSDKSYSHQQHYSSYDYSEYRTVNVDDDGETKEMSYSDYKQADSAPENTNTANTENTNAANTGNTNTVNTKNSNATNRMNTNGADIQENAGGFANRSADTNDSIENFTENSNIDKTINPSNSNILIIIAVLILCVLGVVVFKKFKS